VLYSQTLVDGLDREMVGVGPDVSVISDNGNNHLFACVTYIVSFYGGWQQGVVGKGVTGSGHGLPDWVRDKGLGRFTIESLQGNRAPGDVIEVVHHVALAGFNPPMITNDAVNFGPTRCQTL
jgi:hypothetical protein